MAPTRLAAARRMARTSHKKQAEPEQCSICLEDMRPRSSDIARTSCCNKDFHEACISTWFETCLLANSHAATCPLCRRSLEIYYPHRHGKSSRPRPFSPTKKPTPPPPLPARSEEEEPRRSPPILVHVQGMYWTTHPDWCIDTVFRDMERDLEETQRQLLLWSAQRAAEEKRILSTPAARALPYGDLDGGPSSDNQEEVVQEENDDREHTDHNQGNTHHIPPNRGGSLDHHHHHPPSHNDNHNNKHDDHHNNNNHDTHNRNNHHNNHDTPPPPPNHDKNNHHNPPRNTTTTTTTNNNNNNNNNNNPFPCYLHPPPSFPIISHKISSNHDKTSSSPNHNHNHNHNPPPRHHHTNYPFHPRNLSIAKKNLPPLTMMSSLLCRV